MLDMQREHLLTLAQAAKILPGRPNLATLWRWRTRGIRGGVSDNWKRLCPVERDSHLWRPSKDFKSV